MASGFIGLKGLSELGAQMRDLSDDINVRISKRATNRAAELIRDLIAIRAPVAAKAYVHLGVDVQPGNIGRNVIVKGIPNGQTDLTAESIVTIRSKKQNAEARRVATFFEFGTVYESPKPFFRNGFDSGKVGAVGVMADTLQTGILRNVGK